MTIVVDASVALRWLLPLSGSERADELWRFKDRVIAPNLILAEIANAVWKFATFDESLADVATSAVRESPKAFEELIPTGELRNRALAIGIELQHPVYDCVYLALAEERDAMLVTTDDRLLRRCSGIRFAKFVRPL